MPAIDVEQLTVSYGDVVAVAGLSFTAEAGEVTCVVGRNGAGKTSTIEALEGLRRPQSGQLSVLGLDPVSDHRHLVERIGVMLQDGGIHPAIKVREALEHAAALYRSPVPWSELVGNVGLAGLEGRTYRSLSGGEQKRLALALALVGRPDVAFLDEPTAGVDPEGRVAIRELVTGLRADGVTVVLSSHELDEVERLADRVVMIDAGCLVAEGSVEALLSAAGGGVVSFRAEPGLDGAALGAYLGAEVVELAAGEYRVDDLGRSEAAGEGRTNPEKVVAITSWLATEGIRLQDLRVGRRSLEDVFFAKLGDLDHDRKRSDSTQQGGKAPR